MSYLLLVLNFCDRQTKFELGYIKIKNKIPEMN